MSSDWLKDKMAEMGRFECEGCESFVKSRGHHWRDYPECAPKFSDRQLEILTGLLMGDGHLNTTGKTPYISTKMISENYLQHLDNEFKEFSTGVRFDKTASASAKHARKTGFDTNARPENYSDLYEWRTFRTPSLSAFSDWYKPKKCWPDDIELTPRVLKHWYVCDGSFDSSICIHADNEADNVDKILNYFSESNLPEPTMTVYDRTDNEWADGDRLNISWGVDDSLSIFDYMGEPLPDFKYKWPEEYR